VVSSSNHSGHDLLKNINKLQSTPAPFAPKELHVMGVLKNK
jgi:hypothetical protein